MDTSALIMIWHWWSLRHAPSLTSFSWADNVQYVANSSDAELDVLQGIDTTAKYVSVLDMDLKPGGSYVWSTTTRGRQQLREAMNQVRRRMPTKKTHLKVSVVISHRELGGPSYIRELDSQCHASGTT